LPSLTLTRDVLFRFFWIALRCATRYALFFFLAAKNKSRRGAARGGISF